MLFCYGSESGKVFFIINLILIILLLLYTCELLIWLFIYELSIITILSAFLTEGRSYRRFYALFTLLCFSVLANFISINNLDNNYLYIIDYTLLVILFIFYKNTYISIFNLITWSTRRRFIFRKCFISSFWNEICIIWNFYL